MLIFQNFMSEGGFFMWPILICSLALTAIFFAKFIHFRQCRKDVSPILTSIKNYLMSQNLKELFIKCKMYSGPSAAVIETAVMNADKNREGLRRSLEDLNYELVKDLERYLIWVQVIAKLAPFLGLLGTVCGMYQMFGQISESGEAFVGAIDLSSDIKSALTTSIFGLSVGALSYVAYNFLVYRLDDIIVDMNKTASEMMFILEQYPVNPDVLSQATDEMIAEENARLEQKP